MAFIGFPVLAMWNAVEVAGEDFCNFLDRFGALEKIGGETCNCFCFLGSDRK